MSELKKWWLTTKLSSSIDQSANQLNGVEKRTRMYFNINDICLHTLMFSSWTKWPFWDDNNLTQLTDIISPLCRLKIEFRALYSQKKRNTPKRIIVRQCHVFNLLVRELWQKHQHWMRQGRSGTVLNFLQHWRNTAFVKIVWRR